MIETPFPILPEILAFAGRAEAKAQAAFSAIDTLEQYNGMKVLKAFLDHGVSTAHLSGSTGYGYGDIGRETLDAVSLRPSAPRTPLCGTALSPAPTPLPWDSSACCAGRHPALSDRKPL